MSTKTVQGALDDLALKRATYDDLLQRERFARNAATDARNRLNEAQKAFDAAVAAVRDKPPWDSDWAKFTRVIITVQG